MNQYEFKAKPRINGSIEYIRATARTVTIARWHIVNYYGSTYAIADIPNEIRAPHYMLGEIDCSDCVEGDLIKLEA